MKFDLAKALWSVSPNRMTMSVETEAYMDPYTETLTEVVCRTILFNDDHHTFDEVIDQVILATGCSSSKAEAIAWEVHLRGQACVHEGELFDCIKVSAVLEEIALHTQVLT
jgi:ATP-dependent Clp protease adapter protein ClpS